MLGLELLPGGVALVTWNRGWGTRVDVGAESRVDAIGRNFGDGCMKEASAGRVDLLAASRRADRQGSMFGASVGGDERTPKVQMNHHNNFGPRRDDRDGTWSETMTFASHVIIIHPTAETLPLSIDPLPDGNLSHRWLPKLPVRIDKRRISSALARPARPDTILLPFLLTVQSMPAAG